MWTHGGAVLNNYPDWLYYSGAGETFGTVEKLRTTFIKQRTNASGPYRR